MRKILGITIVAVLVFGLSRCDKRQVQQESKHEASKTFTLAKSPEVLGFSSERLARIDSFYQDKIDKGILPNVVFFIARHGKIVYFKPFGWRDVEKKEPLKKDDIYRWASQSKAITTVGLMMLYEEGRFLLDDPLSKYIPEFKNTQVLVKLNEKDTTYTTRPASQEITIRHLLSHTSGLTYNNPIYDKNRIPYVNSLDNITIKEVALKLAQLPLYHDPGAQFTYGLNTDVVGYLIEVLSGMPLDKYLKSRIFDPLGMNDTYFYLPDDKASRLVTLYEKVHADSTLRLSSDKQNQVYPVEGAKTYFSGGAGLLGPIEDYAKFCQMLLNGGSYNGKQILCRKTIELMTTNQIGDKQVWNRKNKFGLGFELITEEGNKEMLGTVGTFKWGGMYCTEYLIDPKEDLIILEYTNMHPNAFGDGASYFRVMAYQALVE